MRSGRSAEAAFPTIDRRAGRNRAQRDRTPPARTARRRDGRGGRETRLRGDDASASWSRLAGVSKSTFYEHFPSKEECFLATFETIVDEASARVALAYRSEAGPRGDGWSAAFTQFAEIVGEESVAGHAGGRRLADPRAGRRSSSASAAFEAFELMIHQSFAERPGGAQALGPRGAGDRRRDLDGGLSLPPRRLPGGARRPPGTARQLGALLPTQDRSPVAAAATVEAPLPDPIRGVLDWNEPPDSPRSREVLTPARADRPRRGPGRGRVGYASADDPGDLGRRAAPPTRPSTSISTARRKPSSPPSSELSDRALRRRSRRRRARERLAAAGRRRAPRACSNTRSRIRSSPKLAFFELAGGRADGPRPRRRGDQTLHRRFSHPEALPSGRSPRFPRSWSRRSAAGMWAAIQHEIASGDLDSLPDFAPELAAVALTPLLQPRCGGGALRRLSASPRRAPGRA